MMETTNRINISLEGDTVNALFALFTNRNLLQLIQNTLSGEPITAFGNKYINNSSTVIKNIHLDEVPEKWHCTKPTMYKYIRQYKVETFALNGNGKMIVMPETEVERVKKLIGC